MFGFSHEQVQRLALVDERAALGGHVDQRRASAAPRRCGRSRAAPSGSSASACTEPSASLSAVAHALGPQAERLELGDQVAVDLEEVARQRLALEQVRDLRLDALVAAGDRGDRRRRRDGDQQRVAQPVLADARAQRLPARASSSGAHAPRVELQLAARGARLRERRVRALLGGRSTEADSAWK